MRSGGGFDTSVGRDHAMADKRRAERELAEMLKTLEIAGLTSPKTRELLVGGADAATVVEELWPKPPRTAAEHNDLGCALAWRHQWDEALEQFAASENADGANRDARERATRNHDRVTRARTKAGG